MASMRKRLILAKRETTYGTDPVPVVGTDAVLVRDLSVNPLDAQYADRSLIRPYLGRSDQIPTTAQYRVEFEVELAGMKGLGVATPGLSALLRACGLAETIVATTSVAYAPISAAFESATIYAYYDGLLHKLTGARGSVSLQLEKQALPTLKFTLTGLWSPASDSTHGSPVYTDYKTPVPVNATNTTALTLAGYTGAALASLSTMVNSMAVGADIQLHLDAAQFLRAHGDGDAVNAVLGGHQALGGGALGALADVLGALDPQHLDGLVEVPTGLGERVLAVEHSGAGQLPQALDVGSGVVSHVCISSGCVGGLGGFGPGGRASEQLLLPLGQRLAGFGLAVTGGHAGTGLQALGDRGGDHLGQQGCRADGVVVTRDRVVDLVGIAVGVQDRDDRDVQLDGLADGQVLLVGVDDPDGRGHLLHVPDTAERPLELVLLTGQHQDFLLGATLEATGLLHGLEFLEPLQALVHGGEVGEHAAQPALVHVGHADAGGLVSDGLLGLLLGTDEEDRATVGDGLLDELVRLVDVRQRLLEVDDVDAVAVGQDESLHLRVPATGLMSEVGSTIEHLLHGYDSHGCVPQTFNPVDAGDRVIPALAPARPSDLFRENQDQPRPENVRGRAKSDCASTDRSTSVRPRPPMP